MPTPWAMAADVGPQGDWYLSLDAAGWVMGSRCPDTRGSIPHPVDRVQGELGSHGKVGVQSEGKPMVAKKTCLKPRSCQGWGSSRSLSSTPALHFTGWKTEARELGNLVRVTQRVRQSRG